MIVPAAPRRPQPRSVHRRGLLGEGQETDLNVDLDI